MEAKDTMLNDEQLVDAINRFYYPGGGVGRLFVTRPMNSDRGIAEAQAEATWTAREPEIDEARKAGIREVVEWLTKYAVHGKSTPLEIVLVELHRILRIERW